jgi:transcriptional regulator with XRE-family HTH domain
MPQRFSHQTGPRLYQSAGQLLRAYYGLTQQWLADYLGVPRSTVSMDELGRANLPTGSFMRLLPLIQGMPAPDGNAPEPSAEPTAAGLAAAQPLLAHREREARHEARQLGRPQEKLVVRLRQVRLRLQTLPAALGALAPAPADERPRRVLGYWDEDAPDQLRDDEAALTVLNLRQRVLAFELAELAKLLPPPEAPAE